MDPRGSASIDVRGELGVGDEGRGPGLQESVSQLEHGNSTFASAGMTVEGRRRAVYP